MTARSMPERFVLLDGIRGVAAVAIVHRHAEFFFGRPEASSYLAVDLFFALSGFVLAHAYGKRLQNGTVSPVRFMVARFFRLYPLYIVALVLMAAFFVYLFLEGLPTPIDDLHRNIDLGELAFALMTGMLFLPTPFTLTLNGALFLVSPAWSLFNELVANAVYARWGVHARTRAIAILLVISVLGLTIAAHQFGKLHAGFRWHEMYAGMARVFFSFFAGVLIYRFHTGHQQFNRIIPCICLALVCAVLFVPIDDDIRPLFDLFIVLLAWPSLLIVASRYTPGKSLAAISTFLGTASYGLYVLHIPLLAWITFLMPWLGNEGLAYSAGIAFTVFATCLAWFLTRYLDEPMQRRLKQSLRMKIVSASVS
ncbi:acyltransferase [Agrobacterium larrymoorei]|uniref:acyltransferase family protein n=1 Tax=Agrobacterium larrymoorei TaxID=160699 RepID=UPI001574BC93|nr:acyltransferase [Agrobacterium larrymoorei]NTJ43574.1 acyltransferase [Agrobacterium larrymoorei]